MNSIEIFKIIFGGGILLVVCIFIMLILFRLILGLGSMIKSFYRNIMRKLKILKNEARNKDRNKIIEARKKEINVIGDQKLLADIARTGEHSEIRMMAVEKIDDQNILADIAQNVNNFEVLATAIDKLNDQVLLANIAKNSINIRTRKLAVEKLYDQNILIDILRTDKAEPVCEAAIRKINDDHVLLNYFIAKQEWDRCVEIGAPAVEPLLEALCKTQDHNIRTAIAGALDKLGWEPDRNETGAAYWAAKNNLGMCIVIGKPAVKALVHALKNKASQVRIDAAAALGRIQDEAAIGPLIAALKRVEETYAVKKRHLAKPGESYEIYLDDDSPGHSSWHEHGREQSELQQQLKQLDEELTALARALCEITGQDLGKTSDAWKKMRYSKR